MKGDNDLLFEKALELVKSNEFGEAIKYCDDMIINDAGDIDAWDLKSICYFSKNEFLKAAECLEMVIALDSDDDLAKLIHKRCLNITQNDALIETLKKLENLNVIGILSDEQYWAMRNLALMEFYKETI